MARKRRIIVPGVPYHVTHRGNRRGVVFYSDHDRRDYINLLKEYSDEYCLDILAYCLMTNHVHLIVRPGESDSLSRVIRCAHGRYSRRLNQRRDRDGHSWTARYYSCPLDDRHLWEAARYTELNPVRAGLILNPADYPWSSARAHSLGIQDELLSPDRPFPGDTRDWSKWLAEGLPQGLADRIRRDTEHGWACGSQAFAQQLEEQTGMKFGPARMGRPPLARLDQ